MESIREMFEEGICLQTEINIRSGMHYREASRLAHEMFAGKHPVLYHRYYTTTVGGTRIYSAAPIDTTRNIDTGRVGKKKRRKKPVHQPVDTSRDIEPDDDAADDLIHGADEIFAAKKRKREAGDQLQEAAEAILVDKGIDPKQATAAELKAALAQAREENPDLADDYNMLTSRSHHIDEDGDDVSSRKRRRRKLDEEEIDDLTDTDLESEEADDSDDDGFYDDQESEVDPDDIIEEDGPDVRHGKKKKGG